MKRKRFVPRRSLSGPLTPFDSAEEAWFWFVRCLRARRDGARFTQGAGLCVRPCEPDDLFRAVQGLARRRLIGHEHLSMLERFGLMDRPPDPRNRFEERPFQLWDEALDRLTTVLKRKAILR